MSVKDPPVQQKSGGIKCAQELCMPTADTGLQGAGLSRANEASPGSSRDVWEGLRTEEVSGGT